MRMWFLRIPIARPVTVFSPIVQKYVLPQMFLMPKHIAITHKQMHNHNAILFDATESCVLDLVTSNIFVWRV